jgi:hypothetical protein
VVKFLKTVERHAMFLRKYKAYLFPEKVFTNHGAS